MKKMIFNIKKRKEKKNETDESLVSFFSSVELFKSLSKRELKILSMYCYRRTFKAGETVFKIGYPNVAFYIVQEGLLSIYLEEDEKKIEIQTIKPKQFFGEIGLFLEDTRSANIEVVEDSVLIAISKNEFVNFIETKPRSGIKILYKMGEILSSQILASTQKKVKEGTEKNE